MFDYILSFVKEKNIAWDCATGNGQAAVTLAGYFTKVDATDISESQIKNAVVKRIGSADAIYSIETGAKIFADTNLVITSYADELKDLRGVRFSLKRQLKENTSISFASTKPVKVLVGYFAPQRAAFSKDSFFLKAPELETNASANDYGQAEVKIANAMVIKGMPPVNIHSYSFPAGSNELKLGKGVCLVVGFVDGNKEIQLYDAGLIEGGIKKEIDWLFE